MCLLAGLLFEDLSGGLSSGIGAALFDLLIRYISPPLHIRLFQVRNGIYSRKLRRTSDDKAVVIISAAVGQLVHIVLYLLKVYFSMVIVGSTQQAALAAVGTSAVTSSINGVLAIIISVPLYFAIKAALKSTSIYALIDNNSAQPVQG